VSGNTPFHNLLRDYLVTLLRIWLARRRLPRLETHRAGVVISEQEYDFLGNAHGPDVTFFRLEKKGLLNLQKRVQRFVPDLAIEIASPNDTYDSLIRKKERYRRAGTEEVWLISTENFEIAIPYFAPGRHARQRFAARLHDRS